MKRPNDKRSVTTLTYQIIGEDDSKNSLSSAKIADRETDFSMEVKFGILNIYYKDNLVERLRVSKNIESKMKTRLGINLTIGMLNGSVRERGIDKNGLPNINYVHAMLDLMWPDKNVEEIEIYKLRLNKSENAPDYLKRLYGLEIVEEELSLSDIRKIDETLWRALRNWAHAGGHDLELIIPRGRTKPGRPRENLGFDSSSLDPNDPVQAAALKLVQKRKADRLSAAKAYERRKKTRQPTP